MKAFLALCVLVISVHAQVPKPCASPKQWESREYKRDLTRNEATYRKLSYDEENMRIREIEEIEIGKEREYEDRLYLYNERKNYTLNLVTKKCTVTPLTRGFRYRGVFPGARFDGIFNIGAVGVPGEVVAVQAFSKNITDGFYTGIVTYPDCFPVQNIYTSRSGNEFYHEDYFDLNIGITDLNVFVPPMECMQAEQEMLRKHKPVVV